VIVLAIDTSHPTGSVALSVDGTPKGTVRFGEGGSHLSEIGEGVDRLLADVGIAVRDVNRVALVRGPGSFTGLRIGMAYAKGLCAGLGADMVAVSTLELLAFPHLEANVSICPMVDARKGEIYAAVFDPVDRKSAGCPLSARIDPCVREPRSFVEDARRFSPVYVGTGALNYRSIVEAVDPDARLAGEGAAVPSTELLSALASRREPLSERDVAELEPYYIRASDAIFKPLKPIDPNG
jgi:tRNA threonylcarbamoyladenosine biosynthesis protein TsaB